MKCDKEKKKTSLKDGKKRSSDTPVSFIKKKKKQKPKKVKKTDYKKL